MTIRPTFSMFLITLLLIVLPAMSWYYLRKGANYRIAALKELKQDLGKLGTFSQTPVNWKNITNDSLIGKISIVNSVNFQSQFYESQKNTIKKLHEQFGERKDVLFLTFLENSDSLKAFQFINELKFKRNHSVFAFYGDDAKKQEWNKTFLFNSKIGDSATSNPYFVYIDINGTVRNFYDVNNENEIKKMVEHIAMKIFDKKENPRLSRELEK